MRVGAVLAVMRTALVMRGLFACVAFGFHRAAGGHRGA